MMDLNIASRDLLWLSTSRMKFRLRQMVKRILSPRRLIATCLTILFLLWYAFIGVAMLATRQPADPANLQLWLSGGMVLYVIYHCVKCAWTDHQPDLEHSAAESLWLTGGPLPRHSIAVYHVTELLLPTLIKSVLLSVVMLVDVQHPILLVAGVFSALLSLEVVRLTISRLSGALGEVGRRRLRWIVTSVATAVVLQIVCRIFAAVPWGAPIPSYIFESFQAIGATAASDTIQWLSLPWVAGSRLVVTHEFGFSFMINLVGCLAMLPLSVLGYVWVDRNSSRVMHCREVANWKSNAFRNAHRAKSDSQSRTSWWQRFASASSLANSLRWLDEDAAAIASRVATSVSKYRGTLWFSFSIPTALCLSPLLSPQVHNPWFFVVGGVGTCTLLLAPASVRLDFRRDFKRMTLLRSLPITPRSMVLGQLYFPIVVTWIFQAIVLIVAGLVLRPGISSLTMWAGILMALAIFVFAIENAIFLFYPHEERAQGVMMMIRSKITFLGKMALAVLAVVALMLWISVCQTIFPRELVPVAMISGALIASWSAALAALCVTMWAWKRWNPTLETC